MPGSLRLGDARERYGESRRLAKSNGCRFEGWAAEEPGTQRLLVKRRSARLEERHGHNGCKVDDASISPQGMPSRTLVAHRPTRSDDRGLRWGEITCSAPLSKPMPCVAALSESVVKD